MPEITGLDQAKRRIVYLESRLARAEGAYDDLRKMYAKVKLERDEARAAYDSACQTTGEHGARDWSPRVPR